MAKIGFAAVCLARRHTLVTVSDTAFGAGLPAPPAGPCGSPSPRRDRSEPSLPARPSAGRAAGRPRPAYAGGRKMSERGPAGENRRCSPVMDLHVQSVVSCRLDDPGARSCDVALRPPPLAEVDAAALSAPPRIALSRPHSANDVVHATRLLFDPGPVSTVCATADPPSYVEELWSPALVCWMKNCRLKPIVFYDRFTVRIAQRTFLSQAGPRALLCFLKLSITSLKSWEKRVLERQRRPAGSPSKKSHYGSLTKPVRPLQGPASDRPDDRSRVPRSGTAGKQQPTWRPRCDTWYGRFLWT